MIQNFNRVVSLQFSTFLAPSLTFFQDLSEVSSIVFRTLQYFENTENFPAIFPKSSPNFHQRDLKFLQKFLTISLKFISSFSEISSIFHNLRNLRILQNFCENLFTIQFQQFAWTAPFISMFSIRMAAVIGARSIFFWTNS